MKSFQNLSQLSFCHNARVVRVLGGGMLRAWPLHSLAEDALSMGHAEHPSLVRSWTTSCLPGKNESAPVGGWRAEWIFSRSYSSQMLLLWWAPKGGSTEDCLSCVFGGRVCLLMWRQGGEGNCLIRMHGEKKWWDQNGEEVLVVEAWGKWTEGTLN